MLSNKLLPATLAAKLRGASRKYIQKLQQISDRKEAITTLDGFRETGRMMRINQFTSEWGKREEIHQDTVMVCVYITGIHVDFLKSGEYAINTGRVWRKFKSATEAETALWKLHLSKFQQ